MGRLGEEVAVVSEANWMWTIKDLYENPVNNVTFEMRNEGVTYIVQRNRL